MKKFLVLGSWFSVLLHPPLLASDLNEHLANIETAYSTTTALQTEFLQKTTVALTETTVTRPGRFFYQKGGKIRIEYAGDPMTHYISDGTTLWIDYPKEKNLETYSLKHSGLPEEALKFMTELGELRKYFEVSQNEKGNIILKPKKKSTYRSLVCTFDENYFLKDLTINSHSGNQSHYHFFNLVKKRALPEKLFKPN